MLKAIRNHITFLPAHSFIADEGVLLIGMLVVESE